MRLEVVAISDKCSVDKIWSSSGPKWIPVRTSLALPFLLFRNYSYLDIAEDEAMSAFLLNRELKLLRVRLCYLVDDISRR